MARPWEVLLEQVVHERYPQLVAHATLVSASRADAQDLVQEALVSTFSGRARFRSVEQAEAYVRRAIVSRAIDASRRRARESALTERIGGQTTDSHRDDDHLPGADVVRALAVLSPRERACVVLRQMDDLSVQETASVLGLSEGAVKRYTADGMARLTAALHPAAPTTERISISVRRQRGAS